MTTGWDNHRIRNLREQLGLSQERFAERVGVSVRTVSRWEKGSAIPKSLVVIEKLEQLEQQAKEKDIR